MEFIRNLLIIDKSEDQKKLIAQTLKQLTNKIHISSLSNRSQIAEIYAKEKIHSLFLNTNIGEKDVFYILRFFIMLKEKMNEDIPIFINSEDFILLKDITTQFPTLKIQILHTPLDIDDVVKKIQMTLLGKIENLTNKNSKNSLNVDLEFINVFITNTKKVLSEMAQINDLKNLPPVLMANLTEPLDISISSKIIISSSYFKGSYYIAFPTNTFLNLYEIVTMEKCTEINQSNSDFASELANIIYGQCKKKFSDDGLNLDMIIPTLQLGDIQNSVVIIIPFESHIGRFYLAVAPGLI